MATVYSDFYTSGGIPKHQQTGTILSGTYTMGSVSATDIITMLRIPANYKVIDGWMIAADLDTGAIETLELDIGISGDTTKFLNSGVVSGDAVTSLKPTANVRYCFEADDLPYQPTSATDLIVTVTADAATETAADLTVYVIGQYLPQIDAS